MSHYPITATHQCARWWGVWWGALGDTELESVCDKWAGVFLCSMIPATVTELFGMTGRPAGVGLEIRCLVFPSFFSSRCFNSIYVHTLTPFSTAIHPPSPNNDEERVENQATRSHLHTICSCDSDAYLGLLLLWELFWCNTEELRKKGFWQMEAWKM